MSAGVASREGTAGILKTLASLWLLPATSLPSTLASLDDLLSLACLRASSSLYLSR